tara:strand:- start:432 stop:1049 length:618 start_codon:yes stop_codon:yes gene_type:complete
MKINILNYDCGNIWSVKNIFNFLNIDAKVINSTNEILSSDCIILPGDGSFKIINDIEKKGFKEPLDSMVNEKKIPVLGICLGMQLFGTTSEETSHSEKGFNWINGKLKKFKVKKKIPHIGFNNLINLSEPELFKNISKESKFYFVHSYYFEAENKSDVIAETEYEIKFPSVIKKNNIVGTQFHPEKSQNQGIQFIYNFLKKYKLI